MKQVDKSPYPKTQPFAHRPITAGPSSVNSSVPRTALLAAQVETLERLQESLAPPTAPKLWPRMESVGSRVAWALPFKSAVLVVARWITVGTVVLVIHWAAAKYVFLF